MGYVEIIDFAELDEIAREEELAIALRIRTGDFIHPHLPVVETSEVASEAIQQRILSCFSLGNSRTPTQDLEFLIDELVEIALRALSPGINDPLPAITSIDRKSVVQGKSVYVRVDIGGRRIIKKKNKEEKRH